MNVRGAPAIAIAAALALAVELAGAKASLSTPADVAAFVAEKMDYLCTSRPTAVNLGEAVERLKALANGISDGTGDAAAEKVIAECEGMLAADVAANRAIGAFGADALCAAVGKPAGTPIRVLTHCNTGSLATAATAPPSASSAPSASPAASSTSTVTRPAPTTRARASPRTRLPSRRCRHAHLRLRRRQPLMSQGKVDAVVVGADRVADNGDTANKIGTYNLAVSCKHHGVLSSSPRPSPPSIPPRSAAPTSSSRIARPPRSPTALGTRVAASIDVWNPSFDVTPGELIAGIITEKGVVGKTAEEDLPSASRLLGDGRRRA